MRSRLLSQSLLYPAELGLHWISSELPVIPTSPSISADPSAYGSQPRISHDALPMEGRCHSGAWVYYPTGYMSDPAFFGKHGVQGAFLIDSLSQMVCFIPLVVVCFIVNYWRSYLPDSNGPYRLHALTISITAMRLLASTRQYIPLWKNL